MQGDGYQVSFAAASIYQYGSSPLTSVPDAAQRQERSGPHDAPPQRGATLPNSAVKGRRGSRNPPSDDDTLDALDIPTVCRWSGLGRSFVYEAIRRGELRAKKFGRLTRVLRRDYENWLEAAPSIAPTTRQDGLSPLARVAVRRLGPGALR